MCSCTDGRTIYHLGGKNICLAPVYKPDKRAVVEKDRIIADKLDDSALFLAQAY